MMTCVTDRVSVCSSKNQVLVTAKDKCRAPKNAKECLGNTKCYVDQSRFRPLRLWRLTMTMRLNALPRQRIVRCASVAVAGSDGRTTSCVAATTACGTRSAAVGGHCVSSAQLSCPAGEGYDSVNRVCVAVGSLPDAETKLAHCRDAGRHLNAAGDGCIVRVALCGAGNVLASDGVACRTAAACRTGNGAVQGEHCVTASRSTCLADGGRAFNGTLCATPADNAACTAIGAKRESGACVEKTTRVARLNALRKTTTADHVNPEKQGSGEQFSALKTLRAAVQADDGTSTTAVGGETVDGSGTTTDAMYDARLRVIYANQKSLDIVGAAFAYHARDNAVNFGKGSTVSYITDSNFGTYKATADAIPGFDSSGTREKLHRVGVTDFTLLREFPFIYDGSVNSIGTVRSTSEDGRMRLFFNALIRLPGGVLTANSRGVLTKPTTILVEDTLYRTIMSRAHISTTSDTVGSVWAARVRAAATHYGLSVDTGRFARWYVASLASDYKSGTTGSAAAFAGTMATDADRGILNLIAGLIDISDTTISSPGVLRRMTHGIAPSANLNVLTTYGMRPNSDGMFIGKDSQGWVATDGGGKNLPKLAGGINLYDAVLQAGATATQKRGNVILLDNRLAAKNIKAVLGVNPQGNRWWFQNNNGFDSDLASYMRLAAGEFFVREDLDGVDVYKLRGTRRGDEVDDSAADNDLARAVIEGLYGSRTRLYPRTYQNDAFGSNDQGADIMSALSQLGWKRYGGSRDGKENYHYDALIFAAQKTGNDIGLFAGLPIYMHQKAMEWRDDEYMDVIREALRGTRQIDNANFLANIAELGYIFVEDTTSADSGYGVVAPPTDSETDGVLFFIHGGRTVNFYGVPRDLLTSDSTRTITGITFDDDSNTVKVALSKAYDSEMTIDAYIQHRSYKSRRDGRLEIRNMRTLLPYYLAVVAAESGQTPCGIVAQDYCISARVRMRIGLARMIH